jgi:hypothetical protein
VAVVGGWNRTVKEPALTFARSTYWLCALRTVSSIAPFFVANKP